MGGWVDSSKTFWLNSLSHILYRVIFLLVSPQKVVSVEDGKIPTKKVKVGLFNSKMLSFNSDFHFFGRDLPSSTLRTFWGGTSQKNHPVLL